MFKDDKKAPRLHPVVRLELLLRKFLMSCGLLVTCFGAWRLYWFLGPLLSCG